MHISILSGSMEDFQLETECTLLRYTSDIQSRCGGFSCGIDDLDEFFREDAFLYESEMLGKTYCWLTNARPHKIVCMMTLANDSIKSSLLPRNSRNRFNRIFDNQKRNLTYPATLIGRLGVSEEYKGRHVGRQLLQYIKDQTAALDNDNACRFLVVDARNTPDTLAFYEHNGFVFMHRTEEIERQALKRYDANGELIYEITDDEPLFTRMMYFDLKKL